MTAPGRVASWLAPLTAVALVGCAAPAPPPPPPPPPPRASAPVRVAPAPSLPTLPLPEGARACRRHGDCGIATSLRIVRDRADCGRLPLGEVSLNAAAGQTLAATANRVCGPLPHPCDCGDARGHRCCPPIAYRPRSDHAACVRGRCELRPGATWTEDEQAEDAAGRGTDAQGECYRASDCPARALTVFPAGLTDARGRELCPVCPRPGAAPPDEAARITTLAERCPRRQCLPDTVACRQHRCVYSPQRAPRTPVPATAFVEEPAEPPTVPALARGFDYRCTRATACTLAPTAACSCGREVVNRRALERRERLAARCGNLPCNEQRHAPPVVPVCFEGTCVSAAAAAAVREARVAAARLGPPRRAWERQRARSRAVQARHEEIEAGAGAPP